MSHRDRHTHTHTLACTPVPVSYPLALLGHHPASPWLRRNPKYWYRMGKGVREPVILDKGGPSPASLRASCFLSRFYSWRLGKQTPSKKTHLLTDHY